MPSTEAVKLGGASLGLISLVTLTLQNSALTVVLYYSRYSVPAEQSYNAATSVLVTECLKGFISLCVALYTALRRQQNPYQVVGVEDLGEKASVDSDTYVQASSVYDLSVADLAQAARHVKSEILSRDCWKLAVPACLYVVQNNLQFVAASNLDVPTFQVTYNLKILTTALFSVALLRRRVTPHKWFALFLLAAGVGVVQLQSSAGHVAVAGVYEMNRFRGLTAVAAACMTSGLAGVYFEMILKASKTDLWIRNVQLSAFSILPALVPVFCVDGDVQTGANVVKPSIFAHFGLSAWSVVAIQVLGGLVTALVIKYSDNIMKGFATSLAIVLSFCAGVVLFDFQVTTSFIIGTTLVMAATYLYNQPDGIRTSVPLSSLPTSYASKQPSLSPVMEEMSDHRRPHRAPHTPDHVIRVEYEFAATKSILPMVVHREST